MPRRKGALFLPLDVGFPDDDRIVEVGEKSAWLYICMTLAAKRLGTDGVLSSRQIDRLSVPGWRERLGRLVSVDLVAQLDSDVYSITAWFNHNDPIAVVQERRAKDAERKKARTPNGVGSESVRTPSVEKRREEKREEENAEPLLLDVVERVPARHPDSIDAVFDAFWARYPRKVGKEAARKAYAKAVKQADPITLMGAVTRFRDDPTRDEAFTPHPATWLNQGRWQDEGPVRPASSALALVRPRPSASDAAATAALEAGARVAARHAAREGA